MKEIVKLKDEFNRECRIEFEKKGAVQTWKVVKVHKSRPLRPTNDKGTFFLRDNKHARAYFEVVMNMQGVVWTLHGVPISFLHIRIPGRYNGSFSINNLWDEKKDGKEPVGIWKYRD